jgi:glycolate oxidase FAD binding subunit
VDLRFEGTAAGCEVQIAQSLRAASGLTRVEPAADPWDARSTLWTGTEPAAVCKISLLPANLGMLLDSLGGAASRFSLSWRLVAQAIGTGLLRLEADNTSVLIASARELREELESQGGSLVILGCSPEVKAQLDVWGSAGDALDLMNRIKAQFDPGGILNPGRFIARI